MITLTVIQFYFRMSETQVSLQKFCRVYLLLLTDNSLEDQYDAKTLSAFESNVCISYGSQITLQLGIAKSVQNANKQWVRKKITSKISSSIKAKIRFFSRGMKRLNNVAQ